MLASRRVWFAVAACAVSLTAAGAAYAFIAPRPPAAVVRDADPVILAMEKKSPPPSDSCETRFRNCASPREGTFSGRYVTPEDAARCHAERRACLAAQKRGPGR